jgi:hypothetical protein
VRRTAYLVALVAAAAAGYLARKPEIVTVATPAARAPATAVVSPATDLGAVRTIVREELAAALAPRAPAAQPVREPAPEQAVALDAAQRIVDDALARRSWGEDDFARLRELVAGLDTEQTASVLASLSAAINRGELDVDPALRGRLL